jgi:hypothetical protein
MYGQPERYAAPTLSPEVTAVDRKLAKPARLTFLTAVIKQTYIVDWKFSTSVTRIQTFINFL